MIETEDILDKVDDLFLRYGFKSISMDDISRELGISKKTLYQYTRSKADLVRQVLQRHIDKDQQCIVEFSSTSQDAVEEMILMASYILNMLKKLNPKTIYELKKYYRDVYNDWEIFHKEHIYEQIKLNLERGIQEGFYREDLNTDVVAKLYMIRALAIMDEVVFDPNEYRLADIFVEHISLHFHGVTTSKGNRLYRKYTKILSTR